MYKEDLALNNPQWLICHTSQSTGTTNLSQSRPGSNGDEGVLHIPWI